jgi:hypothetical protein
MQVKQYEREYDSGQIPEHRHTHHPQDFFPCPHYRCKQAQAKEVAKMSLEATAVTCVFLAVYREAD